MKNHRTPTGKQTPDLTGCVFHYLTVMSFAGYEKAKGYWTCQCRCGTIKNYLGSSLKRGNTKSCGCFKSEQLAARKTHVMTGASIYYAYNNMLRRCYDVTNDAYPRYGGRGITVCEAWRNSFDEFCKDMGPKPSPEHSLDRFPDLNGPYTPSNCRWALPKEQARNTRRNINISHNGENLSIAAWAEKANLSPHTLRQRLQTMPIEDAITLPVRQGYGGRAKPGESFPLGQGRFHIKVTHQGEMLSLLEWSERTNIPVQTLYARIQRQKWPVEKALTTLPGHRERKFS